MDMEGGNGVPEIVFTSCSRGNSDKELMLETMESKQWLMLMLAELLIGHVPCLETLLFGTMDENS